MIRFSASELPRVELCPASAVLPRVSHSSLAADKGSALHQHIRDRAELGVDEAVARLPEVGAEWGLSEVEASFLRSRLMKFEWSPPPGAICEIRLAVMPDWTVKRIPDGERFYDGALWSGAFDVVWSEPSPLVVNEDGTVHCPEGSVLWALDVKGGQDRYVTTIERNLQVAFYAWAAARWTGSKRVVPAICYPGPGEGDWDVPARMWGPAQLDEIETRLRRLYGTVQKQEKALAAGEPLKLGEGSHCEFCPAQSRCPAKTALIKSALGDPAPYGDAPLSDEQAAQLAAMLSFLRGFVRRGEGALKVHVETTGKPVELGDGVVFGPVEEEKNEILAEPARPVLEEVLGRFADEALKVDISGASIERAVKAMLHAQGLTRGIAPVKRKIWAKLGDAGALSKKKRIEWKSHRPKQAEEQLEAVGADGEVIPIRREPTLTEALQASLKKGAL